MNDSPQRIARKPSLDPDASARATRRRLGFPAIIRALEDRTRTALGREAAVALAPLESREAVLAQLARVGELRAVHRLGETLPLAGVPDVRPHLRRADKEGILEGAALREIAAVLRSAAETARFLRDHAALLPTVSPLWPELGSQEAVARHIEKAIQPNGEVADEASPELAEARARMRGLHSRLRSTAEEMVGARDWEEVLQEQYFTVRGDRYVLPIRASFRYRVGGIVHNVSNTGETVFVEPPQLLEMGNELAMAHAQADEEERRVLRNLAVLVRSVADDLRADLQTLGALDLLEATARLSTDLDASAPGVPEDSGATFDLIDLRHPILVLQGKRVIANDVRLDPPARALVVSGPNAGGKTVTVTAVALSAVMLRHGLPIPAAAHSTLPLYDAVHAVLGDEQDLERDLSTFSAHITGLKNVLEVAAPGTLVLVDEIAADTDPREGAALAVAVIESLLDAQAQVLVTTHLEALKALAATDERLLAAAVGFDPQRMAPTYKLRLKASGGSGALDVAARVGLPEAIVARARTHLSGDEGTLSRAMKALEARQAEAAREVEQLREETRQVERRRAELEEARERLEDERRKVRTESRRELLAEIEAARREVKETIARLQREPAMRKATDADKALEQLEIETRTVQAREEEAAAAPAEVPEGAVVPGTFVRIASLGDREGEILEVDGETALVGLGGLKMRLPVDQLVPLRRAPRKAVAARMRGDAGSKERKAQAARGGPLLGEQERGGGTIDLRGMRVEEGLGELEKRLDAMLQEGVREARIVHGHGTGALRKAVRDQLARTPYVTGSRPGERSEGGDGVTVATLG